MLDSKPVSTPLVVDTSLTTIDGFELVNSTMYCQVVGGLRDLWMTRLDISFVVNKLSQFMHAPSEHHWGAVKRLLRYLNGTRSLGIRLLAGTPLTLHGFSDADWASNLDDRTSIEAFLIFLGVNPISWSCTKQCIVASFSVEVEYHAIAAAAAAVELQWVKSLLLELLVMQLPPTLFLNNLGVTYLSANHVFHSRIKHFVIDHHFVRNLVQLFALRVVYVSVDTFTKPLSRYRNFFLCNKICVIFDIPS